MPVVDYAAKAVRLEQKLLTDPGISDRNRVLVSRFLTVYDVSPARRALFVERIVPILRATLDLEAQRNERDLFDRFFRGLRDRYSPATYATYVNVSLRLVTWLNNGSKPEGFRNVLRPSKKKTKRSLDPGDMITWEDGLTLARSIPSVQLQAILLTQLDGGFRPSEFIDLQYGDVTVKEGLVMVFVQRGKTGPRPVVLHRCVPYFLRWYESHHPSKQTTDPLWVMEYPRHSHAKGADTRSPNLRPYSYDAVLKRIKAAGKRLGLEKPLDFYNLRHSSCVLDKLDNLPNDLAAERHGHSVDHFKEIYGRLSTNDVMNRFRNHYGLDHRAESRIQHCTCGLCGQVNAPDAACCYRCNAPLSTEAGMRRAAVVRQETSGEAALNRALEEERRKRDELERQLQNQVQHFNQQFLELQEQVKTMAIREIELKQRSSV